MVTPARKLDSTSPVSEGATATGVLAERRPSTQRMTCPRCTSQLRFNYDEPQCLQCGYVDYSYTPVHSVNRQKSMVSAGTHYVLRYVGDFPRLKNTLAHAKVQRLRNRAVFGVSCPFCGESMTQSSLSGKRREAREERFKCSQGHRVSLLPTKNGSMGWK